MRTIDGKKQSLIEMTVDNIRKDILSGSYQVGSKYLSEGELCERWQVSRSTVREALRMIQVMGLLELRPGKGAFVAAIDASAGNNAVEWLSGQEATLLDIIEVRMGFEPTAAKFAAQRAAEDEIIVLYGIIAMFERAYNADSAVGMAEADEKLHAQIMQASHNKALLLINDKLSGMLRDYRLGLFSVKGNGRFAIPSHKAIVDAIADRDSERAFNEMLAHISQVSENVRTITRGD